MTDRRLVTCFRFEKVKKKYKGEIITILLTVNDDGLLFIGQKPIGNISMSDGLDLVEAVLNETSNLLYTVQRPLLV